MPKILILCPTKDNMRSDLMYRSVCAEHRMMAMVSHAEFVRWFGGSDEGLDPHRDATGLGKPDSLAARVYHTAPIRQGMIDTFLRDDHTHVMWLDADICVYPNILPDWLLEVSSRDVVAPAVMLEDAENRWYDTAGFVEDGNWANLYPPHFKQQTDIVELDSVGAAYMVPADVYRNGARHEFVEGYTDHYAICMAAKEQGLKVLCDTRIKVYHADLRNYV